MDFSYRPRIATPAFKEWQVIVEALGHGAQILILRKGGIAEEPGGFYVKDTRFWLFPTRFHAQVAKTKPAAAPWFSPADAEDEVALSYFAEITQHAFVSDWSIIAALDPYHLWTEATVRDRFNWAHPPGLHVLIVRVYRTEPPLTLPLTPALGGCKSWIEIPLPFPLAQPALADDAFSRQSAELAKIIALAPSARPHSHPA